MRAGRQRTRRRPRADGAPGLDAVTVLSVYLVLLLAVPASLGVAALGSAGSPSAIVSVFAFFWWIWYHVQRTERLTPHPHPLRVAAMVLLGVMLVVYVHSVLSPIPFDEISPEDSSMLRLFGLLGMLLVASDGIRSTKRMRTLVQRVVLGVGLVALLGVVQSVTKEPLVDRIAIPGLSSSSLELSLAGRSGLSRPSGTATHPIEFGVVLTMALPLAIVLAMRMTRRAWLYRAAFALVAFAVLLSISRSAIICAVVGVSLLAVSWSGLERLLALGSALVILVVAYLTVPGLLGTIGNLFTGISGDTSVASRTGSYDVAGRFISRDPWLGRGFGTFLPRYWILDNQYLGILIEAGILGLLAVLLLFVTALRSASRAARMAADDLDREITRALVAGCAAGATSLAFFDTFAFPQSAGMVFLLLGLAGAALRLAVADRGTETAPSRDWSALGSRWRRAATVSSGSGGE